MPRFFITGTDTGVGKTWFTCWLVRHWRAHGHYAVGLKPISAGGREDAELLHQAANGTLTLDEINPVHLREPAAPLVAAEVEDRVLDFSTLNQTILATAAHFSHVAVEGVGGWRVPLAPGYDVRDWARALGLPVVVVARAGLGTLNHTLLTVDSIRAAGVICAGVVLNPGAETGREHSRRSREEPSPLARRTNGAVLHDLLGIPVFQIESASEAAGEIPLWLGGE
jgi:dethiobiotin synthetase